MKFIIFLSGKLIEFLYDWLMQKLSSKKSFSFSPLTVDEHRPKLKQLAPLARRLESLGSIKLVLKKYTTYGKNMPGSKIETAVKLLIASARR
jgi:hypothetical protein